MKTAWTSGLKPDAKKEIVEDFNSVPALRARLIDILNKKIRSNTGEKHKPENYSLAAWPMFQADGIGYERGLREVISLLESDSVEKNEEKG